MKTKGIVKVINSVNGMVGVLTEDGVYSIIELLSDNIEIGDELVWDDDYPLGQTKILNETQDEEVEVYFQNHDVNEMNLRSSL